MSEYITVTLETGDDPDTVTLVTNQTLAQDGPETYPDRETGDEGSPLAQYLFGIDGLAALEIHETSLVVTRLPDVEWHDLVNDITEALTEFFL